MPEGQGLEKIKILCSDKALPILAQVKPKAKPCPSGANINGIIPQKTLSLHFHYKRITNNSIK